MQRGEYYFAKTMPDLLQQINSVPNAHVMGGCTLDPYVSTTVARRANTRLWRLHDDNAAQDIDTKHKDIFISIHGIKELSQIIKHERYIDCGPGVTLATILEHSGGHIPSVLIEATQTVANPFVRHIATIGGNLMGVRGNAPRYMTLYAPLLALDTKVELKSKADTRYVPLVAFDSVPREYILSNIRIPTDDWTVAIFRRLQCADASFAFLAATEKHTVANVRLAFAGNAAFRSVETENKAIGMRLPLSTQDIDALVDVSHTSFMEKTNAAESDLTLSQFCSLTRYAFELLE